jgi:hypothetical protein
MPPKKKDDTTPGPVMVTNAMPGDGRPHMFKYSSLVGVAGALQMKNMSSAFMKEDRNSYWNRRSSNANAVIDTLREKRRKLYQKGPEDKDDDENANHVHDVEMQGEEAQAPEDKLAQAGRQGSRADNDDDEDDEDSDSDASSSAGTAKKKMKGKSREKDAVRLILLLRFQIVLPFG